MPCGTRKIPDSCALAQLPGMQMEGGDFNEGGEGGCRVWLWVPARARKLGGMRDGEVFGPRLAGMTVVGREA